MLRKKSKYRLHIQIYTCKNKCKQWQVKIEYLESEYQKNYWKSIKNFVMKRAVITLCGTLIDENTKPVQGVIRLENSQTNKVIDSIKTSADGKYCFELPENTALRFNAKIQDFIIQPIEFNSAITS